MRDYLLHLKFDKGWKPSSLRQAVACMRLFSEQCLHLTPWIVFPGAHQGKPHPAHLSPLPGGVEFDGQSTRQPPRKKSAAERLGDANTKDETDELPRKINLEANLSR